MQPNMVEPVNIVRQFQSQLLKRINEEIRRRERVIRIFPNESSLYRLLGALLMEIHDSWQSGKVYLDVTAYLSQRNQAFPNTTQTSVA